MPKKLPPTAKANDSLRRSSRFGHSSTQEEDEEVVINTNNKTNQNGKRRMTKGNTEGANLADVTVNNFRDAELSEEESEDCNSPPSKKKKTPGLHTVSESYMEKLFLQQEKRQESLIRTLIDQKISELELMTEKSTESSRRRRYSSPDQHADGNRDGYRDDSRKRVGHSGPVMLDSQSSDLSTGLRASKGALCGSDVPIKIKTKILKGEYIDFNDLVSSVSEENEQSNIIQLQYDDQLQGKFIAKPRSAKKSLSFDMWTRCSRKFMSLYLQIHGDEDNSGQLAVEMLTYFDAVHDVKARGGDWENFDIKFRKSMASQAFSWADRLMTMHLQLQFTNSPSAITSAENNPAPAQRRHSSDNYYNKKASAREPVKASVPYYYCFAYHTTGRCTAKNCYYDHNCYKCERQGYSDRPHTAMTCQVHYDPRYDNKNSKRCSEFLDIVTPINPTRLEKLLKLTNYNDSDTKFLVKGFSEGFKVGHNNTPLINDKPIKNSTGKETAIMQEKIEKERSLGRVAGPFDSPPFETYKVSPIFLREKSTPGQYRMILDLSFPKDETSINNNIEQKSKSVTYASVRDAIRIATKLRKGSFSAKLDISDAFRLIPLHPDDYNKFCFKNNNKFFFDKVLPQGCGSSCFLFEKFATALHHIFENLTKKHSAVHYLDDIIIFAEEEATCKKLRDIYIQICKYLGVPLAPHKITDPATDTTFLGIQIDTKKSQVRLPQEKIIRYYDDIKAVLPKKAITLKKFQEIIGKLSFATAAVPGRIYLGRLFKLLAGASNKKLIYLNADEKGDLQMWLKFMKTYNGTTFFRSLQIIHGTTINLQADASKLGYGATFGKKWIQGEFSGAWTQLNIAILELYPLYILINMFGNKLKNSIVIFYTDNMAVTEIIKDCMSKDKILLFFMREITLKMLEHNIDLRAEHVPGVKNVLCDKISRLQVTTELLATHNMNKCPDTVPHRLRPTKSLLDQIQT